MNKSPCSSMMSMSTPDMVCSGYLNTPAGTTLRKTLRDFLQSMETQLKTLVSSSTKPWISSWMPTQRWPVLCHASTTGILSTNDASVSLSTCSTPPVSQVKVLAVRVTCWATYLSISWRTSLVLKASAAASSILPQELSEYLLGCLNRLVVEFMTRAAAQAACSCRLRSSSMHTMLIRLLSLSADKSSMSVHGVWQRRTLPSMALPAVWLRAGMVLAPVTSTMTCRLAMILPTHLSTLKTGLAMQKMSAGAMVYHQQGRRSMPGFNALFLNSPQAGLLVWSRQTAPCLL